MLASPDLLPVLQTAPFVLIERLSLSLLAGAGVGALLLVVVAATTFVGHRQTSGAMPAAPSAPSPVVLGAVTTGLVTAVAALVPVGHLPPPGIARRIPPRDASQGAAA